MAQHDYVIANGTGAAVRSDLNNALAAIVSQNSGATAPSTTYAYQWWADTTTGLLKLRNAANNGWITLFQLDGEWSTLAVENGSAAAPSIYFKDSGTDTGIYSPGTDQVAISTGGTGRLFVDSSGRVGLGTSSPGYPLDLVSSGGESIRIRGTSGTEVGKLLFTSNNAGTDYGWLSSASSYLAFGTASTERMRLTSTGLGIGTTTASTLLHLASSDPVIRLQDTDTNAYGQIAVDNSGNVTIQADESNAQASSSIRFNVDGSERVRLDSSGRFLVGTSTARGGWYNSTGTSVSPVIQTDGTSFNTSSLALAHNENSAGEAARILLGKSRGSTAGSFTVVQNGDDLGGIAFQGADGTNFVEGAHIKAFVDGAPGADDLPTRLVFSVTPDSSATPVERIRIESTGFQRSFSSTNTHTARTSVGAGTTNFVYAGVHSATDNATGGTASSYIWSNGNIQNTNGSYTAISDSKLKENIVDAGSQWDDFKAIRIRNWNFKKETGHETHRQIGPIAQELQQVCPGLVFETPDRDEDGNETGEVTKGVNQSVLYMKAVKALQEAMERIEQLETEIATVKAQLQTP